MPRQGPPSRSPFHKLRGQGGGRDERKRGTKGKEERKIEGRRSPESRCPPLGLADPVVVGRGEGGYSSSREVRGVARLTEEEAASTDSAGSQIRQGPAHRGGSASGRRRPGRR